MNRRLFLATALFALAGPAYVRGHPGHPHRILGEVAARHENHVEIKAADGRTSTVTLNEKTKILRGRTRAKPDEIKIGERVVVMAMETKEKDGKTTLVATEIRLGAPAATPTRKSGGRS